MGATWEEVVIDREVNRAWLAFRILLADHLETALAQGHMSQMDITTPTGETLTLSLGDGHAVVAWGDTVFCTPNVDRAAYAAVDTVRNHWAVVHPTFLDTPLVARPEIAVPPQVAAVPVLGEAESAEQLQAWVEASFQELLSVPLEVDDNGDIRWRRDDGPLVIVRVTNPQRIEIFTVLARNASARKAHAVIGRLAREYFALKFFMDEDRVIMSQIVIAGPFCAEQMHRALATFMSDAAKLTWVQEEVARTRSGGTAAGGSAKALAAAQATVAELQERISRLEVGNAMLEDQLQNALARLERMESLRPRPVRRVPRPHAPDSQGNAA